jgi:hypothetical protein
MNLCWFQKILGWCGIIFDDMSWNIWPRHLKISTWKMNISRIFHGMAWNVLKDFVLLMWGYSFAHRLLSLGTNMPLGMFIFEGVSQLGGANILPRDVSYLLLKGMGAWFPSSSHQIPLVPINIPSKSFCSHQVPKHFSSSSSCSRQ